jgi:hypothetical protein
LAKRKEVDVEFVKKCVSILTQVAVNVVERGPEQFQLFHEALTG